jgi:NAD(P)-dependent dehydrogenase (short-subunit alcohol dehydrogenase family)
VLPQEHPGIRIAHIDVDGGDAVTDMVVAELAAGAPQTAVAVRGSKRFTETFEPVTIRTVKPPLNLPANPVVFITGGLGHIGISLAEALFTQARAKLALLARSPMPPPADWESSSQDPQTAPHQKMLLQRLAKMRAQRDEVMVVPADMNNAAQVKNAVDAAIERFGKIDLVVHGAARIDAAAFGPAAETDWNVVEAQFSPKLRGLLYLLDSFRGRNPRRWILHGSISTVLGGLGLAAYSGANAMLDAMAIQHGPEWLSIDWDAWDNAAEAQSASMPTAINQNEGRKFCCGYGKLGIAAGHCRHQWPSGSRRGCNMRTPLRRTKRLDRHPRPNLSLCLSSRVPRWSAR